MTENVKKFLELVSTDEKVKGDFDAICKIEGDEAKQAVTKLANDHGITLTDDDFVPEEPPSGELGDEELDVVAGGKKCYCFLGGGGEVTHSRYEDLCICTGAGFGDYRYGVRCHCVVVGLGDEVSYATSKGYK